MADPWNVPVDDDHLSEGAAVFLCALVHAEGGERAVRLYEACWAFLVRLARQHGGMTEHHPDLSALLKRVKVQQMDNQLKRAHRTIINRLITRDHIIGGVLKPLAIPIAGATTTLKLVTSRATTREISRRRRDPGAVRRDRIWAQAKKISPATAGPMPPTFAGRLGPEPIPATEIVITEDVDASLNALIIEAAKHLGVTPRNFRRDWLNPARPVLHMTQALYQLISEVKNHEDREEDNAAVIRHFSPRRLLLQPQWVRKAIKHANRTREWWPAHQQQWPALRAIDPEQFIRLAPHPADC